MQKSKVVQIQNLCGLHARPSASFVKIASGFKSDIFLSNDNDEVNAKSIIGVLMLSASKGTNLTITADGPDADDALESLELLVNNKFGED